MTKQTETKSESLRERRFWHAIQIDHAIYEDEERAANSRLTESQANKLAAAINSALRSTGNHSDGREVTGRNYDAVAQPVPTGETRGIIQIVDDSRWTVTVGKVDGCCLLPIYHFTSDVEVAHFARMILMLIEDETEMLQTIDEWMERWL